MVQPRSLVLLAVVSMICGGVVCAEGQPDLSSSLANTLTHTGISAPVVSTIGLTYLGNEHQERAGRQAGDALLATGIATLALKKAFRRPRPNDPLAEDGFPSGHASISFAFARAISDEYPDWGKLAYVWATGVVWSRVKRNDHSVEQVLAGAALGWYLADRSIHSPGGLFDGLVVDDGPRTSAAQPTSQMGRPTVQLWGTVW